MSVDLEVRTPARAEVVVPVFPIPAAAVPAWLQLQDALDLVSVEPPCRAAPDVWFAGPGQPSLLDRAVEGCGRCPVLWLCRAYAVAACELDGVWGGLTPADRRSRRQG